MKELRPKIHEIRIYVWPLNSDSFLYPQVLHKFVLRIIFVRGAASTQKVLVSLKSAREVLHSYGLYRFGAHTHTHALTQTHTRLLLLLLLLALRPHLFCTWRLALVLHILPHRPVLHQACLGNPKSHVEGMASTANSTHPSDEVFV